MKNATIMILAAAAAAPVTAAGPVSKFDAKKPVAAYVSPSKLEDIERCLIEMDGLVPPIVYRQPDRPDEAMLLWRVGMSLSLGRIDLKRAEAGTKITSWLDAKQVSACAPEG